ncbi:hypothetical protein Cni_G16734 [Canna indica]|uniref:Uncharacterized protein n=1 Tax=Canna indica TaxID=4628 RepID=A0AAQ3KFN0_9LILI|nr:hypothetical protein Cni_G16734 [Canna indica]
MLKEQVDVLLRENSVLKRAFMIQRDRQKEYEKGNEELEHLKQLVTQYQEQVRTLEAKGRTRIYRYLRIEVCNPLPMILVKPPDERGSMDI